MQDPCFGLPVKEIYGTFRYRKLQLRIDLRSIMGIYLKYKVYTVYINIYVRVVAKELCKLNNAGKLYCIRDSFILDKYGMLGSESEADFLPFLGCSCLFADN